MLCGECTYTEALGNGIQVKCTITEELREMTEECNCEFTRELHDKRTAMSEKADVACEALAALREKIENGVKSVDAWYVYDTLLEIANEGTISDKLNEVIAYLEGFVNV